MNGALESAHTYDANGNLTSDGVRGYEYDDENQLTRITQTNAWQSEFTYDGANRRRIRKEYTWSGGAWVLADEVRYVYDGQLVIQERSAANAPRYTYTRGLDLAGTLQGAGGIGGLLAREDHTNGTPSLALALYVGDGRGNVSSLVSTSGLVVAHYTYDPYGNVLAKTGPLADSNGYQFSSKEVHAASGLIYFGRRYFSPTLQRWINQDPIQEQGGLNIHQYVGNNPKNIIDPFGLDQLDNYEPIWFQAKPTALDHVFNGVALGAGVAAVVAIASPLAVSGLVALGVTEGTASATVTAGLAVTAVGGGVITTLNTIDDVRNQNWDNVAFTGGTLFGGGLVGSFGGGSLLAEGISGSQTSALPGLFGDIGLGYSPNFPGGSLVGWLSSGPTPQSGGAAATLIASGVGSLLSPSPLLTNLLDPLSSVSVNGKTCESALSVSRVVVVRPKASQAEFEAFWYNRLSDYGKTWWNEVNGLPQSPYAWRSGWSQFSSWLGVWGDRESWVGELAQMYQDDLRTSKYAYR